MAAQMDMNVLMTGKTAAYRAPAFVMKRMGNGCALTIAMGAPVSKLWKYVLI
jgi:hypothetical protein